MGVQTRNEDGELRYFDHLGEAFKYAEEASCPVWKISFEYNGDRIRLVSEGFGWRYEGILEGLGMER